MRLLLAALMTLAGTVVYFGSTTDSEAGNYYRRSSCRPSHVTIYHRPVYRSYRTVSYRPVHYARYRPVYTRYGGTYTAYRGGSHRGYRRCR